MSTATMVGPYQITPQAQPSQILSYANPFGGNADIPGTYNGHIYSVNDSSVPYMGPNQGWASVLDDSGLASGQAFLESELEWRDRQLYKPLTSTTWTRDMPVKTGGGPVSFTSNYFVNYATSGANQYGLVNGQSTEVPIIQQNVSKDIFPVFPWQNIIRVPLLDQDRLQYVGESLDQIFQDGLKLNYQKTLDVNVYTGFPNVGTTGLINNATVYATSVATGASGYTTWSTKTAQEILNDINTGVYETWSAGQYDLDSMANHLLIPPKQFTQISQMLISTAGNQSVLNYARQFSIANEQGRPLVISPCRQCAAAGSGSTDRMVFYVNDINKIHFNLPVPLHRKLTQPSVLHSAYLTLYEGFIGVVKILYYPPIAYYDGI